MEHTHRTVGPSSALRCLRPTKGARRLPRPQVQLAKDPKGTIEVNVSTFGSLSSYPNNDLHILMGSFQLVFLNSSHLAGHYFYPLKMVHVFHWFLSRFDTKNEGDNGKKKKKISEKFKGHQSFRRNVLML